MASIVAKLMLLCRGQACLIVLISAQHQTLRRLRDPEIPCRGTVPAFVEGYVGCVGRGIEAQMHVGTVSSCRLISPPFEQLAEAATLRSARRLDDGCRRLSRSCWRRVAG